MEQAARRQDRGGDEGEKEHDAPAGAGAAPEEPFSLLQELPAPLMRQLVQCLLGAEDCLSLLRTSHALARAAVQHCTHHPEQRRALKWTWESRLLEGSEQFSAMDAPEVATAAALLVRWAPAELHVKLREEVHHHPAVSLPAALLPLITSLRLHKMHLTPAAMDGLQQCQRLHTLHVDECGFAEVAPTEPAARSLQALPLLRTFRYWVSGGRLGSKLWAVRDLGRLCALATDVQIGYLLGDWTPHLSSARRWDLGCHGLGPRKLEALLHLPHLRHVHASDLDLDQDLSQQQCQWQTLTTTRLGGAGHLLRLPAGVGRVVVTERLGTAATTEQEAAAVLQRWCAPGRLRVEAGAPPHGEAIERWCLVSEAQAGFFVLEVPSVSAVESNVPLLQRTVLAPDGGPRTLALEVASACSVPHALHCLAPLLAGTRVRTLCLSMQSNGFGLEAMLGVLPPCIACVRLCGTVHQAREVVSGPAARHRLRLVVLLYRTPYEPPAFMDEKQELRELCAAHQRLVQLEVVWSTELAAP